MKVNGDLLDLLVPVSARDEPRRRLRHRGIAKSLLSISGVVAILFLVYVLVRPELTLQEALLFVVAILSPTGGALFVRFTGRIELGLFLTNLAGIAIVAFWCWVTGGILSVALPWFLPNLFLLSTFGSKRMLVVTAGVLLMVLVALFLATGRGWLPPSQIPAVLTPEFTFLSLLSSVSVVVVAAIAATGEREKSKRLLFEAKNAAEAANRAKSAFLASMSHELRTPLNAVLLSADLLKEDQEPPLSGRQAQLVDQLRRGGELLLGLVNQVLELSSIEAGKLSLTLANTSLSEAVSSALNVIVPLAARKQVQVEFDLEAFADLEVLADPVHLKSVLINLLSNAVKYNRLEGRVFIEARRTPAGTVRIEIRDTGTGIPDHFREAAFQPFNRLGAEGTQIEGTGLGLSITEHLVRMMSGSLGFESVPGQGSTFWVEFLAAQQPSTEWTSQPPAVIDTGMDLPPGSPLPTVPLDVLVVEDHPINQQLLRQSLERRGHRVTLASNGAEALQALGDPGGPPPFEVVLMDVMMPVMDGLEATRRIRQREAGTGRHIPIVAVTACALDQDRDACLKAGMDEHLAKPVDIQELFRILGRVAAGRQPGVER